MNTNTYNQFFSHNSKHLQIFFANNRATTYKWSQNHYLKDRTMQRNTSDVLQDSRWHWCDRPQMIRSKQWKVDSHDHVIACKWRLANSQVITYKWLQDFYLQDSIMWTRTCNLTSDPRLDVITWKWSEASNGKWIRVITSKYASNHLQWSHVFSLMWSQRRWIFARTQHSHSPKIWRMICNYSPMMNSNGKSWYKCNQEMTSNY